MGLGNAGTGVPRLANVSIDLLEWTKDVPSGNHKQALPALWKPKLGEILDLVSNIIPCFVDIIDQ